MNDDFQTRDVYLTKDGDIIGIHAVGYEGPYEYTEVGLDGTETSKQTDFQVLEIWGNEYDEEHNMLGQGSFRVFHHNVDECIKELEEDGWVHREAPKGKEMTAEENIKDASQEVSTWPEWKIENTKNVLTEPTIKVPK